MHPLVIRTHLERHPELPATTLLICTGNSSAFAATYRQAAATRHGSVSIHKSQDIFDKLKNRHTGITICEIKASEKDDGSCSHLLL